MSSWTGIPELIQSYRVMGARKFWFSMATTLGWIGLGTWLSMTVTWPGQCDHSGRKIVGLVNQIFCSPHLLDGGLREWMLFVWLWSMPGVVIACLIYAFVKKRGIFKKNGSE